MTDEELREVHAMLMKYYVGEQDDEARVTLARMLLEDTGYRVAEKYEGMGEDL